MQVYARECTHRHANGVQEVASSNLAAPIAELVINKALLMVSGWMALDPLLHWVATLRSASGQLLRYRRVISESLSVRFEHRINVSKLLPRDGSHTYAYRVPWGGSVNVLG